ncbi:hypothetical protein BX070DRAFT_226443 [Coemansia spiralis]|nr:hypothetical protein BX070DRAFT_226443 [Coemansia spiralis]
MVSLFAWGAFRWGRSMLFLAIESTMSQACHFSLSLFLWVSATTADSLIFFRERALVQASMAIISKLFNPNYSLLFLLPAF